MKRLAQHFLSCAWVTKKILEAAHIDTNDTVLEIGPGHGELTYAIAERARLVFAVEKDAKLAARLRENLNKKGVENVEVAHADIRDFLRSSQLKIQSEQIKIVGNIPYYLTSLLFRMLLSGKEKPKQIVFTIQKEVAERICAKPPRMNLLALSVQAFGTPEIICAVPAACFSPKPRVDSAIFTILQISNDFFEKNSLNQEKFFAVIKKAFSMRRKTLVNALSPLLEKEQIKTLLTRLNVSPHARAQELSLQNWISFCR